MLGEKHNYLINHSFGALSEVSSSRRSVPLCVLRVLRAPRRMPLSLPSLAKARFQNCAGVAMDDTARVRR